MNASLGLFDDPLSAREPAVTLEVAFLDEAVPTAFAYEGLRVEMRPHVIQCVAKLDKVLGTHLAVEVLVRPIRFLVKHKRLF